MDRGWKKRLGEVRYSVQVSNMTPEKVRDAMHDIGEEQAHHEKVSRLFRHAWYRGLLGVFCMWTGLHFYEKYGLVAVFVAGCGLSLSMQMGSRLNERDTLIDHHDCLLDD